jgi:hypothetical protein
MDSTQPKQEKMGLLEAGQEEDQKLVVSPQAPEEQQPTGRGTKRVRRERGATAKERVSKAPPCTAGKRSSKYRGVTRLVFSSILCTHAITHV